MEVITVSLSDPWISLTVDSTTKQILGFIPIIAFVALLVTAIWIQAKKFPVNAIGDSNSNSDRSF